MKADRLCWHPGSGWTRPSNDVAQAQLVIYFGPRRLIESKAFLSGLRDLFRQARLVGASTGGQIFDGAVTDSFITALALRFETGTVRATSETGVCRATSHGAGRSIALRLADEDLKGIFLLSDGTEVDGSQLVEGITSVIGAEVTIAGGLAGDGNDARTTVVGLDELIAPGVVVAVGFCGESVSLRCGSCGGWDEFGPARKVTRSEANLLLEMDGRPALDLYERYLGDEAADLPLTALRYPLLVRDPEDPQSAVIRAVLAINRERRALILGCRVPEGWSAQLMRGYFDRLAEGAAEAARRAMAWPRSGRSGIAAIAVSCNGRRVLMGQNILDEVIALEEELGPDVTMIGFYSYGEISPLVFAGRCELQNQTMTVTTICETDGDAPSAA